MEDILRDRLKFYIITEFEIVSYKYRTVLLGIVMLNKMVSPIVRCVKILVVT
jgi:hypothetical protein